jgi:hypothetical protein
MTATAPEPAQARQLLHHLTALRRDTRRVRGAHWFPIALFGLLMLLLASLRAARPPVVTGPVGSDGGVLTLDLPPRVGLVWFIGVPLVYVVTFAFYRWRSRRIGVGTSRAGYALAGAGLFGLLAILVVLSVLPPDLDVRGLSPLLAVAAGFGVLSYVERSAALAAFSAGFLALALTVNLYSDYSADGYYLGPLAVAVYLLISAAAFGVAARRSRGPRA